MAAKKGFVVMVEKLLNKGAKLDVKVTILVISSKFCTNFYPLTGFVNFCNDISRTSLLHSSIDKLNSPLLLKVLPLIKNAPFLIITSFHLVLITPSISV
jgi:hypothetical protein